MKPPYSTVLSILAAEHPKPMDALELWERMRLRGVLEEGNLESMVEFIAVTDYLVDQGDIQPIQTPNILYYAMTDKSLEELNQRLETHGITLERLKSDIRTELRRMSA